jgi:hypothetical protein
MHALSIKLERMMIFSCVLVVSMAGISLEFQVTGKYDKNQSMMVS